MGNHSFVGTPRWSAPEVLQGGSECYTPAADIFSLAMTFFEIFTGEYPFNSVKREREAAECIINGMRPKFPQNHEKQSSARNTEEPTEVALVKLIKRAWDVRPETRPTSAQLLCELISLFPPSLQHMEDMLTAIDVVMNPRYQLMANRRYRIKTYKHCIVGREVVAAWIANEALPRITSIEEAVAMGQKLESRGFLQHVARDHSFLNEHLFYFVNYEAALYIQQDIRCRYRHGWQ